MSATSSFTYICHTFVTNDSYGNRTRVTAVKGRCLNRLTKEPSYEHLQTVFWSVTCDACNLLGEIFSNLVGCKMHKTPRVGLEPTTPRLTAVCSTIELSRIIYKNQSVSPLIDTYKVCVPSKFHMEFQEILLVNPSTD